MRAIPLLLLLPFWAQAAPPGFSPGVDVFIEKLPNWARGKRAVLLTHAAAVASDLTPSADALHRLAGLRLTALLGPEHGVRGAAWAGEKVSDQRDLKTGLPMYSLYGKDIKPTPEMLQGAELILYDVQDIGVRSYTYIATLAALMEAAAESGLPLVVLDRPDPLGGLRVEGNVPPPGFTRSLVCPLPIPYVYGLTPGELARMINGEGWLPGGRRCELRVVPMRGWRRSMRFSETGLSWVPTSPHIPRSESAHFYAATGVLGELRVVNEGVGYPLPFELLGAPWADGEKLAEKLNALRLPGLRFRPLAYKPFYGTHKGLLCSGVQIHLLDPARAPSVALQFHAIAALRELHPEHDPLKEASPEAKQGFDRVLGGPQVREALESGRPVSELLGTWERELESFRRARRKYLLY